MNENRREFIKNIALAGGCVFISLSPTNLFGEEEKLVVPMLFLIIILLCLIKM